MSVGFIFFKLKIEIKCTLIEVYTDKLITCDDLSFYFLSIDEYIALCGFLGGSMVKNPPAKQEIQVPSLSEENPLEKDMAAHCSILSS